MQARQTSAPGQQGTRKLVEPYEARLVYVPFGYDEQNRRRYETVDLIVEGATGGPTTETKSGGEDLVSLLIKEDFPEKRAREIADVYYHIRAFLRGHRKRNYKRLYRSIIESQCKAVLLGCHATQL